MKHTFTSKSLSQKDKLYEKLEAYTASGAGLKKRISSKHTSKINTLNVLPIVAVTVLGTVGTVHGQCYFNIADSQNIPQAGAPGNGFGFDVDGDMVNDFSIFGDIGVGALKLNILNADFSVLRNTGAGITDNYASALNVPDGANVMAGYGGGNFVDENNDDLYLAYGNLNGEFSTPGNIIFRSSSTGNLGFIDFSVESGSPLGAGGTNIDIDVAGLSANSGAITSNNCATLPVELTSFKADVKLDMIALSWVTASETENAGFEVERSENGKNFKSLTFIEGKGNTLEQEEYHFNDKGIRKNQLYYYRLKQIDFDGNFERSEVITAKFKGEDKPTGTFAPNPVVAGLTELEYYTPKEGTLNLQIFDVSGKALWNKVEKVSVGINNLSLDLSNITSGTYFIKMEQDGNNTYEQIVID